MKIDSWMTWEHFLWRERKPKNWVCIALSVMLGYFQDLQLNQFYSRLSF
jgi:hypothetical protein